MYSNTTLEPFSTYIKELLANNITYIRIDIPNYQDVGWVSRSKLCIPYAVSQGVNVVWGVSSTGAGNELTAANWNDYRLASLDAAAWAEANGVYEFQLGNELEGSIDGTTLTAAQLIINLKSLATEVQAVFTRGNISYSCMPGSLSSWITAGKGDLDILAFNNYMGGLTFNDNWKNYINIAIAAFGSDGTYMTEFSLSYISLDSYSTNEETQLAALNEMINYIKNSGMKRAHFFYFIGDAFGARKANGVARKIWDLIKIQNDWKLRKTASKSGLGGLSHGKH